MGEHVIKLNYTSLQHPVEPVEVAEDADERRAEAAGRGDLPPRPPGAGRVGGAAAAPGSAGRVRPGSWCRPARRAVARPRRSARARADLRPHHGRAPPTVASTRRSLVAGAIDAAARRLGWDAVVVGPGPGSSARPRRLGHGGMAALDAAHAALALGMPTLLCARMSSTDERPRHRGLSHHTATVLEMLLAPVRVPVPEAEIEGWPLLGARARRRAGRRRPRSTT